jgi:hypothetical protein
MSGPGSEKETVEEILDFHRQSTVTFHHAEHFKNIFPISRDI